jgi:hypothetical protein
LYQRKNEGFAMKRKRSHSFGGILSAASGAGKIFSLLLAGVVTTAASVSAAPAQKTNERLWSGFLVPPHDSRPTVGWQWMNGNVTEDGIRKDFAWMNRVGIVGFGTGDATIDTPQVVPHRLVYLSPEWKNTFRYAIGLAAKYGMHAGTGAASGWSMTGGPWVTPQDAMKKLVWSEIRVTGGKPFHGVLPQPPSGIGPLQNAPMAGDEKPTAKTAALKFYRDVAVVAYPTPVSEPVPTAIRTESGRLDVKKLTDGDLTDGPTLKPATENGMLWIEATYKRPVTIQGVTLGMQVAKNLGYNVDVEASDNGKDWRHVAAFPEVAQLQRFQMGEQTVSFAPAAGRYFRVVLMPAKPLPKSLRPASAAAPGMVQPPPPSKKNDNAMLTGAGVSQRFYNVNELVFHADATVNEFEKKAMFAAPPRDFYKIASTPKFAPGSAIDPAKVVVLSTNMKPDGTLDWTPPRGNWTVMRFGYSLTGAENHPAPVEATGLEVDKLDADSVRAYMEHRIADLEKIVGKDLMGKRGLTSIGLGSSEIGQQNWTGKMIAEFKRLRGYDPTPYLPAMTGAAVVSPAASDKFLWDFRRTVEELFAKNHYRVFTEVLHAHGLKSGGQALEDHRPTFGDDMEMRQYFDSVGAAMWTYDTDMFPAALTYEADVLGGASVAHIYGQNIVSAESLTSDVQPWSSAPRDLKRYIDMEFVRGVDQVGIHTSVHQPIDRPPGISLGGFGQFFTRHESWAEMAKPWLDYIARCSWMLRQGHFAGDILYFYGQEAPITSIWGNERVTDVPEGYAFDFGNGDVLLNRISVKDGLLATETGMRYRVLYLGGSSQRMTLKALRKVRKLAEAGATVVGKPPLESPSLADDPAAFAAEADALFGPAGAGGVHVVGKGRVFAAGSLSEAFAAMKLLPDFAYTKTESDSWVLYLHRHLDDGEIYFVSNRRNRAEKITATFRVAGYRPEIWDAVYGTSASADYRIVDGRTNVTLDLPANGSAFVVFRHPAESAALVLPKRTQTTVATLHGPWQVAFQKDRGAPAAITLKTLQSWSDSADLGVKYFSGRAAYRKSFVLPAKAFAPGTKLFLDLGDVREIAEVTLNGKSVGPVWTTPYRLDITKCASPGKNILKVTIANLWVNRLIGDAQPDVERKYTFSIIPTYRADAPLRPSGLMGPVRVMLTTATDWKK